MQLKSEFWRAWVSEVRCCRSCGRPPFKRFPPLFLAGVSSSSFFFFLAVLLVSVLAEHKLPRQELRVFVVHFEPPRGLVIIHVQTRQELLQPHRFVVVVLVAGPSYSCALGHVLCARSLPSGARATSSRSSGARCQGSRGGGRVQCDVVSSPPRRICKLSRRRISAHLGPPSALSPDGEHPRARRPRSRRGLRQVRVGLAWLGLG
mmetsp:Transcript_4102/g.8785  ORF Transcript_4102/g.8785 Transcript_4102/m.8785 type:complete len:205 (-) Transcript_4102:1036-1650(-)